MTTINARILPYQKTAAQLATENDVPLQGEKVRETDTGREKTGNGTDHYNDLQYDIVSAADIGDAITEYLTAHPPSGSPTNLTITRTGTAVTVESSSGTDVALPAADGANAGVMTAAMQQKLAGIDVDDDATLAANSAAKIASQRATRAFVIAKLAELIGAAPAELDTWIELVAAIQDNDDALAGIATSLAGKQAKFFTGAVSTAAATATKAVTVTGTPAAGDYLTVTFTNGSTATSPTLSINSVGAYPIRTPNAGSVSTQTSMAAGAVVTLHFDGTYLWLPGATQNSSWSEITDAEIVNPAHAVAALITGRRMATALATRQPAFLAATTATVVGTAPKVATMTTAPVAGDYLWLTFTNGNSANSPTLAVNGGTAYPIQTPSAGTIGASLLVAAGFGLLLQFNGSVYRTMGATQNTIYAILSDAEAANPAHTTGSLITGQRLETLLAAEAQKSRILLDKTIDGDANTLQDIPISALKTTGTPDGTKSLHGDGAWKVSVGGANNYLIWVGDLVTGVGAGWPARPANGLPTIWIGGAAPRDTPSEQIAGDFWQPAVGDATDFGAVVEALQTLSLAAGKVPYFVSGSAAGVLDLKTTIAASPSDTAVPSEAAFKNYVDRLVTQAAKTAAYSLVATDQGTVLEYNSASNATFTVDNVFSAGNVVGFRSVNTGILTIAAGTGVTLRSFNSAFKLAGQWAEASLHFRTNVEAVLSGQLIA